MSCYNKKILWLTDFTTKEVPAGGAEITDSYIIQAGRAMGYDIQVVRPDFYKSKYLTDIDLVVFSNNFEFPDNIKAGIMKRHKYIAYSHDIGRWGDVIRRNPVMFQNAEASIFLSPGHRDKFSRYLEKAKNVLCIPPHIPQAFYDRGLVRRERVMYAGNLYDGKGLMNILELVKKNPKVRVDFYYQRHSSHILSALEGEKRCILRGYIPAGDLFKVFNEYRYFIHLPKEYEAFGRAVAEAYLSGCSLVVNHKVGAMSYNWSQKEFREATLFSHYRFWEVLKSLKIL